MTTAMVVSNRSWHSPQPRAHREFERHAGWYLLAGVITTAAQMLLFLALRPPLGSYTANLLAIGLTTIVNTEFHRRITFAGVPSKPARRHLQTVLTFTFYAGYGSAVLLLLHALVGDPTPAVETIALTTASFLGGVARFFMLKLWVFTRR